MIATREAAAIVSAHEIRCVAIDPVDKVLDFGGVLYPPDEKAEVTYARALNVAEQNFQAFRAAGFPTIFAVTWKYRGVMLAVHIWADKGP